MLVGKPAPLFACQAIVKGQIKDLNLEDYIGQPIVLFFYPLDFSFVCPTELHAFQDAYAEFERRGVQLLALSVDSVYSHLNWLAQPKEQGGVAGIKYPLLSDMTKCIANMYDVLDDTGVAVRGLFIIDKKGIIQVAQINNLSFGRSIPEVLRLIDAIEYSEKHGEACPANWLAGETGLKTSHEGVVDYFKKHN